MYALQTVGSTTSSVKDDTEVLELDDTGNSIAEHIINNSHAIKRSGKLTKPNGYQSSQTHPIIHSYDEQESDDENFSVSLFFWAIFQAVGLACVAAIICRAIMYHDGYFEESSYPNATSISPVQFSNWHFLLITVGLYLYANSIFMIKNKKLDVSLPYIMLHTFSLIVWALGLYAMYVSKEMSKPIGSKFYVVHLYSIDTWAYVVAAVLFALQWLSAVFAYMLPFLRKVGLPLGRMFSMYTVLAISIALIAEANQQVVQLLKGDYKTYSVETYILNGFGMLVMLFLFLIVYIVVNPKKNTL